MNYDPTLPIALGLLFLVAGFVLGYDARAAKCYREHEHPDEGRLTAWEITCPDGASEFVLTQSHTYEGARHNACCVADAMYPDHVDHTLFVHPYPGGVAALLAEQYDGTAILNSSNRGF